MMKLKFKRIIMENNDKKFILIIISMFCGIYIGFLLEELISFNNIYINCTEWRQYCESLTKYWGLQINTFTETLINLIMIIIVLFFEIYIILKNNIYFWITLFFTLTIYFILHIHNVWGYI